MARGGRGRDLDVDRVGEEANSGDADSSIEVPETLAESLVGLPRTAARIWSCTFLLTSSLIISFLRSARAGADTIGEEKINIVVESESERTEASESDRRERRKVVYGRRGGGA